MKMLYFCLLLGYFALGIPTMRSYPHRVVHVFSMHRQPSQIFRIYIPPYNMSERNMGNSLYSRDDSAPNFGNSLYSRDDSERNLGNGLYSRDESERNLGNSLYSRDDSEPNLGNSLYSRDESEPNLGNSLYSRDESEPNFKNSLNSNDHNLENPVYPAFPPMRKLFHDMMSFLDRSMGSIADMDNEYNKPLSHKVEDPWIHFITRTKIAQSGLNGKSNTTTIETNTTNTTEKDSNTTVLGNHTKGDTAASDRNMGLTTNVTKTNNTANHNGKENVNITMAANLNESKRFDHVSEHIGVNDFNDEAKIPFRLRGMDRTVQLVRRRRRHSNKCKLEHVTTVKSAETMNGSTTTKPLTMLFGNQSEIVWNNMNQTKDALQSDNQTKEIASFTSTVEKMINMIDKQLENKTQALLKRMKRVMEIKDDLLKDSYVKYNVTKNNTESNVTKQVVDSTLTNDNNTDNLLNKTKTINTTEHETKTTDITTGRMETMATIANITSMEPLANTTAHTLSSTTVTILPASMNTNQTNFTSLSVPLEAHTMIQTESKPGLSTGLSVENSNNEEEPIKQDTHCPFSVLSSTRVNGILSDEHTSETNAPSRTMAKTKEIWDDNDENGQKLRNILDSIPDNNNLINRRSGKVKDDDQVTGGDLMTALVIPVFLVVLMGSILYAMHNMSQYVINYIGETNVDRTNQDNNHELTTLILTNPEPTLTANQINTNRSPSNHDNNEERTTLLIVNNLEPNNVNNSELIGNTVEMLPRRSFTPATRIRTNNSEETP